MEVRDWVQDYFGESANSLLDEGVYSDEDLRRDKIKLRKQRKQIEKEMNQYADKALTILEDLPDSAEKQAFAELILFIVNRSK